MFHKDAREFINKVIRSRRKLIDIGESKINKQWAIDRMDLIKRYLDYYGYKNDRSFAMFWSQHRNEIMELMPGGKSKLAGKFLFEFNQIDGLHSIILANKEYA